MEGVKKNSQLSINRGLAVSMYVLAWNQEALRFV
jgi:hypothetical protein